MTRPTRQKMKQEPSSSASGGVLVRMYRDILGDCFLLRFPGKQKFSYVLIDCGILQGMPDASARAHRIMSDILSVTSILDVLVVTHEHVDHLSGFDHAKSIFDQIHVKELWLAWTEDPRDERAKQLRERRQKVKELLSKSYAAFASSQSIALDLEYECDGDADTTEIDSESAAMPEALDELSNVLAFAGIGPEGFSANGRATTTSILESLKAKAETVRYLRPGERPKLGEASDVGVYVLGPPTDDTMIKRSKPRKVNSEVYQLSGDAGEDYLLAASIMLDADDSDLDADDLQRLKMSLPFGLRAMIPLDNRLEAIGLPSDPEAQASNLATYDDAAHDWRRIDIDWLGATELLALKLDSDTNNTSLVLAFELGVGVDSRVLLFPGDAQVGNWLSWHDLVWPLETENDLKNCITAKDLLAKTVLYKVGHHASHNATPRELGLELMTHPDLVAMIPVDENFAVNSKHWKMPYPALLNRLMEKTGGRVIRADRSKAETEEFALSTLPPGLRLETIQWTSFSQNLTEINDSDGALALEYRIAYANPSNNL